MTDIKPINGKLEDVELATLHIRYVPAAKLEQFWKAEDMMALPTSPHVEILKIYLEHGWNWKKLKHTPYAEERRQRRSVFGQKQWIEDYLKAHIAHRIDTYRSMKKLGFKVQLSAKKPVMVLKEPFWKTRFGLVNDKIRGPEIWNGAGRCAAAYVLEWKTIPGMWVEDARPGANECAAIERKFRA